MTKSNPPRNEMTSSGNVLRVIPRQVFFFPNGIDPDNYEVNSYIHGGKLKKLKGLSKSDFDSIQAIEPPKEWDGEFISAIGHRAKDKSYTSLIMQKLK